jgi:hypothetical protein
MSVSDPTLAPWWSRLAGPRADATGSTHGCLGRPRNVWSGERGRTCCCTCNTVTGPGAHDSSTPSAAWPQLRPLDAVASGPTATSVCLLRPRQATLVGGACCRGAAIAAVQAGKCPGHGSLAMPRWSHQQWLDVGCAKQGTTHRHRRCGLPPIAAMVVGPPPVTAIANTARLPLMWGSGGPVWRPFCVLHEERQYAAPQCLAGHHLRRPPGGSHSCGQGG